MRILHILDHSLPLQSGYVFRTMSLLEHQRRIGLETFQFTTPRHSGSHNQTETVDGYLFYRSPPVGNLAARLPVVREISEMLTTIRYLRKLIDQIRPDVLHAHSPVLNALPTLWVGKRYGLPVVYEVRALWEDGAVDHGTGSPKSVKYRISKYLETFAVRRADAVTTICDGLKQEFVGRGVPADKVSIIPNGVDVTRFSTTGKASDKIVDRLGLEGKRVIGFIGSFYRYEGLSLLLEAFAIVRDQIPQATLLLVGGGFEDDRLRQQASELGLGQDIIFTGRVPNKDVEAYYSVMEALIYPRLNTRLTELVTPLKPLEAMAMGKLIIASDVGGHKELVQNGKTGLLFPAGDKQALAEVISQVLGDSEQMEQIRRSARAYVEGERNWTELVALYEPIYSALADATV